MVVNVGVIELDVIVVVVEVVVWVYDVVFDGGGCGDYFEGWVGFEGVGDDMVVLLVVWYVVKVCGIEIRVWSDCEDGGVFWIE